jgi:hypothetical protein
VWFPHDLSEIVKQYCSLTRDELKTKFDAAHPKCGRSFSPYFWPERYRRQPGMRDLSEKTVPRFAWLYERNEPGHRLEELTLEMLSTTLRRSDIQRYGVLVLYIGQKPEGWWFDHDADRLVANYQAVRLEDLDKFRQWLETACGYLFHTGSLFPFSWFGKRTFKFYRRQKRMLQRQCDVYRSKFAYL